MLFPVKPMEQKWLFPLINKIFVFLGDWLECEPVNQNVCSQEGMNSITRSLYLTEILKSW